VRVDVADVARLDAGIDADAAAGRPAFIVAATVTRELQTANCLNYDEPDNLGSHRFY